jgi:hypothetical protein
MGMIRSGAQSRMVGACWTGGLLLALLIGCSGSTSGELSSETRAVGGGSWYGLASPVPETAQLIGLDPLALRHMLGPPDFQRREAPAEFWRYDLEPCTLDLFLHRASPSVPYQVAHAQLRPAGPGVRDCRMPILAVRAAAPVADSLPPVESH